MRPPALPFSRFLLYARQLLRDRPEGVRRIAREYGDIVRVPVPGKPFYLLSAPVFAKRVLETNSKNYRKSFDFRTVREFLGDGLITVKATSGAWDGNRCNLPSKKMSSMP
jgi:hypothetical protein